MGNGLIFPYHSVVRLTPRGDAGAEVTVGWWIPMQGGRRFRVGKSAWSSRAPMPKGPSGPAKGRGAYCQEKPRGGVLAVTVP